MRKPLKILAIVSCLILAILSARCLSFLFLLFCLLVCEFDPLGPRPLRGDRTDRPGPASWAAQASLHAFDDLTDPLKSR